MHRDLILAVGERRIQIVATQLMRYLTGEFPILNSKHPGEGHAFTGKLYSIH